MISKTLDHHHEISLHRSNRRFSDGPEVDDRSAGRFIDPRAISAHPDTAILINNRHGTPGPKRIGSIFYSRQPMKHLLSRVARTNGKREVVERGMYEYV